MPGPPTTPALLSIAIPTWNRASYLKQSLDQLRAELQGVEPGLVEVLVSDNCSPDDTGAVVAGARAEGLPVRYVRNETNLGWGHNFFQCFDLARAKYVLLLGDDDLLVDGALGLLLGRLREANHGVVCVRTYGFDHDFRAECPGRYGRELGYTDPNEFLVAIGPTATMISACILNKELLRDADTSTLFCGDLAHLHLVLLAALRGSTNLFINQPLIACKRNNSANYKFSTIFVEEYWRIMDAYVAHGLAPAAIRTIEDRMLFSYYPFYLLTERRAGQGDHRLSRQHFAARFGRRLLYRFWVAPILVWPDGLAIGWGAVTTTIGRVLGGDLRRGIYFAKNWLIQQLSR